MLGTFYHWKDQLALEATLPNPRKMSSFLCHPSFVACQSMRLLGDASESFRKNCVVGIQANRSKISSIMKEVCQSAKEFRRLRVFVRWIT